MNALATEIDHLVVAVNSLDEGRAWAQQILGAVPVGGGKHDGLATQNTLLKLDATDASNRRRYLEIIAIDPDAGAANFARWFGLDGDEVQADIRHGPRLVAWVARCSGAPDAIEQLAVTPGYAANVVRAASRADFRWRFAFTPDGARIAGGTVPHLIQWEGAAHPCDRLPASGVSLTALMLGMPEPLGTTELLDSLRFSDANVQIGQSAAPSLVAILQSPNGCVVLD